MHRRWIKPIVVLAALAALPAMAGDGATPIPFMDPYMTPHVITMPGSYVVTRNLTSTAAGGGGPIILVDCNAFPPGPPGKAVTIDLNGFIVDAGGVGGPTIQIVDNTRMCEVTLRNGEVLGGGLPGIIDVAGPIRKVVIEDLEVKDGTAAGIYMRDPQEVVVRRTTIMDCRQGPGIHLTGGVKKNGTIEDNLIRRTWDGIAIDFATSLEISNNRIEEISAPGPIGGGIALMEVENCLVAQNTINDITIGSAAGPFRGISLISTRGCKLLNNLTSTIGHEGIYIDPGSEGNLIKDNVVHQSYRDGIRVDGNSNRIEGNVCNNNGLFGGSPGHGLHIGPNTRNNHMTKNTGEGNAGGPCFFLWSPEVCDDGGSSPPGGGPNWSFRDNLMGGAAGLF